MFILLIAAVYCQFDEDGELIPEFLEPLTISLLSQHRRESPYGLEGGAPGSPGKQSLLRGEQTTLLPGCTSFLVETHDRILIETPGGGGYDRESAGV